MAWRCAVCPGDFFATEEAGLIALNAKTGKPIPGFGQLGKVPWGTGDVPIREVLLLKREKYPIVAHIEYDYGGGTDPWNEMKKCFAYCKSALESAHEWNPRCAI